MKTVLKSVIAVVAAIVVLWIITGDNYAQPEAYRVSDGSVIGFSELIKEIRSADVIFVGEFHNDEYHHRLQLDIIEGLEETGVPMAVGFEMFTAKSQQALDQWVDGELSRKRFVKIYYENWKLPWPLYKNIFLYLRDKRIPALGLNIPQKIAQKVASSGFASMSQDELKQLPPSISCNVDEEYMRFIERAYMAHEKKDGHFVFFCEAQLLWDKSMAWHLLNYLKDHPDRTAVVLAGTGHAWKRGIPEQIKEMSDGIKYKVLLPEVPDYIDPQNITTDDADYILRGGG
jgi:uncharacterized iron-regulated protein